MLWTSWCRKFDACATYVTSAISFHRSRPSRALMNALLAIAKEYANRGSKRRSALIAVNSVRRDCGRWRANTLPAIIVGDSRRETSDSVTTVYNLISRIRPCFFLPRARTRSFQNDDEGFRGRAPSLVLIPDPRDCSVGFTEFRWTRAREIEFFSVRFKTNRLSISLIWD